MPSARRRRTTLPARAFARTVALALVAGLAVVGLQTSGQAADGSRAGALSEPERATPRRDVVPTFAPGARSLPEYDAAAPSDGYAAGTTKRIGTSRATGPTGTVRGTVVADDGGAALADIDVAAYAYYDEDDVWVAWAYGTTAADGSFRFSVPTGTYRIAFQGELHQTEFHPGARLIGQGENVTIASGEERVIDASLALAGWIEGSVSAAGASTPPAGTSVALFESYSYYGTLQWRQVAVTHVRANGRYRLNQSPGTYRVVFFDGDEVWSDHWYGGAPSIWTATDVEITAVGEGTAGIDATLVRRGYVTGTVRSKKTGQPFPGVTVYLVRNYGTAENTDWGVVTSTTTGAAGTYRLKGSVGSYTVAFQRDGFLTFFGSDESEDDATTVLVRAGRDTTGVDGLLEDARRVFRLVKPPTISGTPRVGATLTASTGRWRPAPAAYSYAWLVDGRRIPGATARTLKLTRAQAGRRISVQVSPLRPDTADASAASARTAAVKVAPEMRLTARAAGTAITLRLSVTAAGVRAVTGRVRILRDGKLLRTLTLRNARAKVRLTGQPKGRHTYKATYAGAGPVLPGAASVRVVL
ncbi:Ig-like domain-containing protein [Nocardioides lijunqiniae]|uniref:Ig-like domain-containing protein n=1 Tax=Nocardioides lijunqiniae TaxID=2760832 RepID=UPI0018777572|nr:Ig-like domain-containing protein [Nocardioides lijunqiniae]